MINKQYRTDYLRTDMAEECCESTDLENGIRGISYKEYKQQGIGITKLEITDKEGEKIIGKPCGTYITLRVGKIWLADDETFENTAEVLSQEFKKLASGICPDIDSILVAGLGNRYITSDSIGPLVIKDLVVTRHIKTLDPVLFGKLSSLSVSALVPGVIGQTGIETAEIIKGAAKNVSPSLIVVIDALAAKNVDRLAVTVQISDTGISPGSGIGNTGKAINKETVGIPVISIGVPTVVDSSTLIYDVLERAGLEEIPQKLKKELDNGKSFFVTLKDADSAARETARLIAKSLNYAFSV